MSEADEANSRLMTFIGLLGGQILSYLNGNGATPLQQLTRWICQLGWSAVIVRMAIDVLVRGGLVRIEQGTEDATIKPTYREEYYGAEPRVGGRESFDLSQ